MKHAVWVLLIFLVGCGTSQHLNRTDIQGQSNLGKAQFLPGVSTNTTYGYSPENPVKVGGGKSTGAQNEVSYLSALFDKNGKPVKFRQIDNCCPEYVDSANLNKMLHRFLIKYRGSREADTLYLDIYEHEQPYAPMGFTVKKARD